MPDKSHPEFSSDYLWRLLQDYKVVGLKNDETSFWPRSALERCLTTKVVLRSLSFPDVPEGTLAAEALARQICRTDDETGRSYIQLFALLVRCNKIMDAPVVFDEHRGICDADLPLKYEPRVSRYLKKNGAKGSLDCFVRSSWKLKDAETFDRWQWRFCPHVFKRDGSGAAPHSTLEPKRLLPWISYDPISNGSPEESPRSGGFGDVSKRKIHPDCHNFGPLLQKLNLKADCVAVKQLRGDREESFSQAQREADQLRLFDGQLHLHLVTLLATYAIQGEYFFLFPYAEHNLEDLWEEEVLPSNLKDAATIRWLSKQMCGLLGALAQIHEPRKVAPGKYGRHGDIKPDNILCYRTHNSPGWHLVISDLGVSALNSEHSRSNVPGENVPEIPGYRPPECDVKGGSINRLFDVWTMGCLFLEMVAHMIGGKRLRDEFDDRRTTLFIIGGARTNVFYDLVELEDGGFRQSVKTEVLQCFDKLRADAGSSQYIQDVLTVIEDRMLVILRKDKALVRSTSDKLVEILNRLHHKCEKDEDYCISPSPRPLPQNSREPIAVLVELNERSISQLHRQPLQKRSGKEKVSMDSKKMAELGLVEPRGEGNNKYLEVPI